MASFRGRVEANLVGLLTFTNLKFHVVMKEYEELFADRDQVKTAKMKLRKCHVSTRDNKKFTQRQDAMLKLP